MAGNKDHVIAEVKRARRKLAARLLKARAAGRELEELRALEREGDKAYHAAVNAQGNGRRRK